jgi:CarD family transcriptional regulator
MAQFQVGDHVVYPTQGAGRIVAEVERQIAGQPQMCFEIELLKGSMRVLVPKMSVERVRLRRIIAATEVPGLLAAIATDLDLPAAWTPRHRREQTLLADGDILTVAALMGTLARRDHEKPLSVTERRLMDEAKAMVVTEVAMARQVTMEEAGQTVEDRIAAGLG